MRPKRHGGSEIVVTYRSIRRARDNIAPIEGLKT